MVKIWPFHLTDMVVVLRKRTVNLLAEVSY
jgi:hypothetical protein